MAQSGADKAYKRHEALNCRFRFNASNGPATASPASSVRGHMPRTAHEGGVRLWTYSPIIGVENSQKDAAGVRTF